MRGLFWVLLLAALAVAVTLGARYHTGYVLLVLHPYRVELSLNLLAAILFLAFIAAYLSVRLIARTLNLPSDVRQYRERRRIDRAHRSLNEALRAYLEGRYARAEKAATGLIEADEFSGIAAVIAARAANELRAYDRRDRYLARSVYYGDDDHTMRTITQAELALQAGDHQRALATLDALPHKHVAALRLELKAVQQSRNWDRYIEILNLLGRAHALEERHIQELKRHAIALNLARKAADAGELGEYWRRLDSTARKDAVVAAAAARAFALSSDCRAAHAIIEASLDANWDSGLVELYGECPGEDVTRQIEQAEKWLVRHPADATLLLTLGRLCLRCQLWGKARSYFEASLALEKSYCGHMELAQLLERNGEVDAAREHYRASLALASAELQKRRAGTSVTEAGH